MPGASSSRFSAMKFPSNLEADYQTDLGPEKIRVLRQTCALAIILYASFGILDMWAIPSAYLQVWAIRSVVVMISMLLIGWANWWPHALLSQYVTVTCMFHLVLGVGILAMIPLAQLTDLAWGSYYTGLILVCAALPLNYLAILPILGLGILYVAAYFFVAVQIQGMLTSQHWPLLMMNGFFLTSTTIVSITVVKIRERYSRDAYLLRRTLHRDIEMTKEAKRQSDFLAEHDVLTGMPNRICFLRQLEAMIEHATDAHATITIFFIDLNGFKPINDVYGHRVGDEILVTVSERMRSCVRGTDVAARLGGDEFVVAITLKRQYQSSVHRLQENLADAIACPITVGDNTLSVTASIGVAMYPDDGNNASELIDIADVRMYEAKRESKAALRSAMPATFGQDLYSPFGIADSTASHV
jgi:diguanylate cyclase (GGDEF)-like protein